MPSSQPFVRPALPLLALLTLAAGCKPKDFDAFEKSAPIRAYESPSNRLPGFGRVMTALEAGPLASDASLIVASAGRNAPVVFERMWTGSKIDDEAITRCRRSNECKDGEGVGLALIPVRKWARGTPQEETTCIFSPGSPKAFIFCDSDTSLNQSWVLDVGADYPGDNNTVFFSGVGLPEGHSLGLAVFGTHVVSGRSNLPGSGRLFYQPEFLPPGPRSDDDVVPNPVPLPLRDPRNQEPFASDPEPGNLGYALALATDAQGVQLLAVSQPSRGRVIVASYDDKQPGSVEDKLITRACVTSPDLNLPGFGKRLLLGDVNDDGRPELFVGIDPIDNLENPEGLQRVWMYRGAQLPAPEAASDDCPAWPAPIQVGCHDGVRGIDCAGTAFGASLALGDVDGDGFHDLMVGAPHADVQSGQNAGVVWLIPGGPDSPASGGLDFERMTNLFATKKRDANLGMAVAALRTNGRYEPVAGAPGEDRLYTFMCTKLESENGRNLCLPD